MDGSDTTRSVRAAGRFFRAQDAAASELRRHVSKLVALATTPMREEHRDHRVLALLHQICASILACEESGLKREEIAPMLERVRRIHARSPFPALSRSIAQQQRNTAWHQAARILKTMLGNPRETKIASLACGNCPDLRSIHEDLPALAGEIWLTDADAEALELSAAGLRSVRDRIHFRIGEVLPVARSLPRGRFDLVVAGGLFDSLSARRAAPLVKIAYGLLSPGGVFFFTNMREGNPYRPLIEYFGDARLFERPEEEIRAICDAAGIPRSNCSVRHEETGAALLVEAAKLQ